MIASFLLLVGDVAATYCQLRALCSRRFATSRLATNSLPKLYELQCRACVGVGHKYVAGPSCLSPTHLLILAQVGHSTAYHTSLVYSASYTSPAGFGLFGPACIKRPAPGQHFSPFVRPGRSFQPSVELLPRRRSQPVRSASADS